MECLSLICGIVPCLWDCSAKHAAYLNDLKINLTYLRTAMDELNNLTQDVRNRVREAEEQQMRPTNKVNGWLLSVESLGEEVNLILLKSAQQVENKCGFESCCPKNCWYSYKLSKKVMKVLPQVKRLTQMGEFEIVAHKLPRPLVDELPMENSVVGFESKLREVWQYVEDKDSAVIGLVGIGGAGKTTLLKQLNNEFLKTSHAFDLVIWIVVSTPLDLGRIRDAIRRKLNISDALWDNISDEERVVLIFNKLKEKKFVVLLDDLWERLELSEVGIPQPCVVKMTKIVFTTRSREICQSMDAQKLVKVGCLPPDQALNLFCSKVGEDVLKSHPELKELVKDVASECKGLPLALITIGRSMKDKTSAQQWKDAKRVLRKYPSTFPGMEGRVFSKLVFSYDSLPTLTLRKCFEYCSIFREDQSIEEDELIKIWIAEGLLNEYDGVYDALIQGRQIIERLKQACLLEVGEWDGYVKMHDVIRDMALWLACERGGKKNKFVINVVSVHDDAHNEMTKWKESEKVSLWGDGITLKSLASLSFCTNLVTLIIRNTKLKVLGGEIFQTMKALKVLDLSYNGELIELPLEIGDLINLEYLNTRFTGVTRLPVEVEKLKNLMFMLLNYRTKIPGTILSNLEALQTFDQHEGLRHTVDCDEGEERAMEKEMLQQLEGLEHIMDVCLVLCWTDSINQFLESPKVQGCTRMLTLEWSDDLPEVLDLSSGKLKKHLEWLKIERCDMSVVKFGSLSDAQISSNLRQVYIVDCESIRNLSSLVYVPNICGIHVDSCESLEELMGESNDDSGRVVLSSLRSLTLWNLPKLRSICRAMTVPCLKEMEVIDCDNLRELPFDWNTATTSGVELKIKGCSWWWDQLQWETQQTMDAFASKFQQVLIPRQPI